jgi:hypothetical protein
MFRPMMAIIGRRPIIQRKCFTCITCMSCLVRVKTLVLCVWAGLWCCAMCFDRTRTKPTQYRRLTGTHNKILINRKILLILTKHILNTRVLILSNQHHASEDPHYLQLRKASPCLERGLLWTNYVLKLFFSWYDTVWPGKRNMLSPSSGGYQEVGIYLQDCTVWQTRRPTFENVSPWKPQISPKNELVLYLSLRIKSQRKGTLNLDENLTKRYALF